MYRPAPVGLRKHFLSKVFQLDRDYAVIYFQMTPRIGWCLVTDVAEPWVEERLDQAMEILFADRIV